MARAAARRMYARWRRMPLQEQVLLESFEGSAAACNPAAIAAFLQEHTDLPIVWALREAPSDPAMAWVRYRSAAYFKTLATSKYLINNVTFPPLFDKRDDQVYLNTWHGTPLKRMGRDVGAPYAHDANTIANFACADILLSSGPYMTDTIYVGAYGVGRENVVELGSPRVDVQFAGHHVPDLVLYAPTWQQASASEALDDLDDVADRIEAIAHAVRPGLRAMVRVHGKVAARAAAHPRLAEYLAPAEISTNRLLARSATLITDYSSVAFDYLATGSDLLFFTPVDYARGTYLTDQELPGPRTSSVAQLQSWLRDGAPAAGVDLDRARSVYCPYDDGAATQRVTERLLAFSG
jgi:CDP-glycerol glycerophosphotransferase (TagB/SpsB family)